MTQIKFNKDGTDVIIRFAIGECSIGSILIATSKHSVCSISLGDDPKTLAQDLQNRFPKAVLKEGDAGFTQLIAKIIGFIEMPRGSLDLPLDVRGTAFQQRVWQMLQQIPAGLTMSYSEIAIRIGAPKSARAVAGACAANLLAIAIPCHRAVRINGDSSGYRWGVERKRTLLEREGRYFNQSTADC